MIRSVLLALLLLVAGPVSAQVDPITMTLDEAVQIALINNHVVRTLRLEVENGNALVGEGFAELMPSIDLSSSYTRNVRSVNPFAGSSAGGLFQSLGFLDWLAFNEDARTDTDPGSAPISAADFFARQQAGLDAAGVPASDPGANPFEVPTQIRGGIAVTQKLFDGRAITGATGARRWLGPLNQANLDREEQLLVHRVRQAFYGSLLAGERARVVAQSVDRSGATLTEVARQVSGGVAPKFQRLTAEVALANLETDLVNSENAAAATIDELRLLLGVPGDRTIRLRGALETERTVELLLIDAEDAVTTALTRRPDLESARIGVELELIQLKVARSEFLPELNAVANLGYSGSIPDNRLSVQSVAGDPFSYTTQSFGFFADPYWDWDFNVGFSLRWNLFNGFASRSRVQQRKIKLQQAEIAEEFLKRSVAVEVDRSRRDLTAARRRMDSQKQNVARAELSYTFAETRLREGVATPIEVREASDQLDLSRLNHLQAIHDFLVARSSYETALGAPIQGPALTRND